MDIATLLGFVLGLVFVMIAMLYPMDFNIAVWAKSFIDIQSILITVGGMIAGTLIAHPLPKVISAMKAFMKAIKPEALSPADAIAQIINLSNIARKEGLIALETQASEMNDEFMKKGLMLIADGADPELLKNILETEMAYVESRHSAIRGVWDFIGSAAPAWGMIGTLIGLVQMLRDLSDPETLGPNMAIALITTLYGSLIANYVAVPISNKLKIYTSEEMLLKEVLIEGLLSIQAGENPRYIEEKLKAFLSPALRGNQDDGKAGGA